MKLQENSFDTTGIEWYQGNKVIRQMTTEAEEKYFKSLSLNTPPEVVNYFLEKAYDLCTDSEFNRIKELLGGKRNREYRGELSNWYGDIPYEDASDAVKQQIINFIKSVIRRFIRALKHDSDPTYSRDVYNYWKHLEESQTSFAKDFKLYENLWDDFTETSSVFAEIPGTDKKLECKGVSHIEALEALLDFINKLTSEEKLELYFHWGNDNYNPGDCEGNPILNKDSEDDYVYDNTDISTVPEDTYDKVVAALGIN